MIAAVNSSQYTPHAGRGRSHALPLQETRSDIGLFLDRIIIAKRCRRPAFTVRIYPGVSNELREPDGVAAAPGVLDDMRHDAKPVLIEQ